MTKRKSTSGGFKGVSHEGGRVGARRGEVDRGGPMKLVSPGLSPGTTTLPLSGGPQPRVIYVSRNDPGFERQEQQSRPVVPATLAVRVLGQENTPASVSPQRTCESVTMPRWQPLSPSRLVMT